MNFWFITLCVQLFYLRYASAEEPTNVLKVTLFFESMCPGCHNLITKQLYPAYTKIGSSLQMELVPYGNAIRKFENGTWVISCQHGPDECERNKFEACGLAKSDNQDKQMDFINCVENHVSPYDSNPYYHCASKLGLPEAELLKCSEGQEGNDLLAVYGDKQNAAAPFMRYVPWLLFNNKHSEGIEEKAFANFLKIACDMLSNRPQNCSQFNELS